MIPTQKLKRKEKSMATVTGTYPVHYKTQGWELTGAIADKLVSKNLWKHTAQTQGLEPSERTA